MTSSHHPLHQAKFRWTENLTCRFIQLRKEHGKMFTGRKYSAQAGWEYILRQMREEFPTIMADVHYRVLKKKWSNLLQQYKELKNPVHGDKNKADDISWPFYTAIEEVVGNLNLTPRRSLSYTNDDGEEDDDDDLNPQEFLSVSVGSVDDDKSEVNLDYDDVNPPGLPQLQPLGQGPVFDIDRSSKSSKWRSPTSPRKRGVALEEEGNSLLSRLPSATELTIRPVPINTNGSGGSGGGGGGGGGGSSSAAATAAGEAAAAKAASAAGAGKAVPESPVKRSRDEAPAGEGRESRLESRIVEFLEYTRRRDEENRAILMRMLEAIEDIRNAVG